MTAATLRTTAPADAPQAAELRAVAHGLGTAACIALLTFAARLALDTVPPSQERDQGFRALALAARLAGGEPVDPFLIVDALHDEQDDGLEVYLQSVSGSRDGGAWTVVVCMLGYAAYHASLHRNEHPYSLVENFGLDEALDLVIDPLRDVPALDWAAVRRAADHARKHGSKAAEGWGKPMQLGDLR